MPHWNAPELARLHRDLEMAYRHLPDGHDDAKRLLDAIEAVENLDFDLGELEIATPSESTSSWGMVSHG